MSNKTEINPNINATVINSALGNSTQINTEIAMSNGVNAGVVLDGGYKIVEPLNVSTGEANLYICTKDNMTFVAKIYKRQRAIKPEVINELKAINSPFVAPLIDTGFYNEMPFEILPYYKNGSLQGKRFSLKELKSTIVPCINEALKVLHQHDIIHKDLKPSNIMVNENNKSVAIIDFGISSVIEDGNTVLITKTGMTPDYSAPETFKSVFLEESDYYSFGITLYELFTGTTPYRNMSSDEIARYVAVQKIPFPKDMPEELQNLIYALTYHDITNRNNKNNPNRRWTYQEVANWCKGIDQTIPGNGVGLVSEKTMPEYKFMGVGYKNVPALVAAMAGNWKDGKKQLYRGIMSSFFKSFDPEIAGYCMDAEEEANGANGKEDLIFWKLLYKIHPSLEAFYWLEKRYASLPALGEEMLKKLNLNDSTDYAYWHSILENKLLSEYLSAKGISDTELFFAVTALEKSHSLLKNNGRECMMNYYLMAYLLSGNKVLTVGDEQFCEVSELAAYMKKILDTSYEEFEKFCRKLIGADDVLDVQFEAWLIALGKRDEISRWKKGL